MKTLVLHPEEPPAGPWRVEPLTGLIDRIRGPAPARTVLAVDGRSSSGKTTLTLRIAAVVPSTAVVHTDDLAWHHSAFDWDDLLVEGILGPVRRGHAVSYRPPAWERRSRPGAIEVPGGVGLLVVEGVGSGRRSLTPHLDAIIWVQSDLPTTLARDQTRVAAGEISPNDYQGWMAEERPFQAAQGTWQRASVIVAGTPDIDHDHATHAVTADPIHTGNLA